VSVTVEITCRVTLSEEQIEDLAISTDPGEEVDDDAVGEAVAELFSNDPSEFMDHYALHGKVKAEVV